MGGVYKIAGLVIAITWCLAVISCSAMSMDHVTSKRTLTRWCGPSLAQALHLVCDGAYQTMFSKKSSHFNIRDLGVPVEEDEDVEENSAVGAAAGAVMDKMPLFPFFVPRLPMEVRLAKEGLRVRRGVSDECCHHGCTLAVLRTYCLE